MLLYWLIILCISLSICLKRKVVIFHLIDNALWGESDGSAIQGVFPCSMYCEIVSSDSKSNHVENLRGKMTIRKRHINLRNNSRYVYTTVGLYNIHTWVLHSERPHAPNATLFPTDLTLVESEESTVRFQALFQRSFPHFHGSSTTHPSSTVPRSYFLGLNQSEFLPLKPFESLIKGAVFVASTCHRGEGNTKRISLVKELQKYLRVDSLGKCHRSKYIPEGVVLHSGPTAKESLYLKQLAISNYMFYLAFENNNERGYVTEKVFDALIGGTVPVYLGASVDCKKLMPSSKAAIYVEDFGYNASALSAYLLSLMNNKDSYEEHRSWRQAFNPFNQVSPLFQKNWPCRICEWAVSLRPV